MRQHLIRPRLFWQVLSVETRKLMAYRFDFWATTVVSFAVNLGIAYALWRAIFDASGQEEIGGFDFVAMMRYYVTVLIVRRLVRVHERQRGLSADIYEGTLTRYRLYPTPYLPMKYAEHLGGLLPAVVQVVVLIAAVLLVAPGDVVARALAALTPGALVMGLGAIAVANLLSYLLIVPIQGIAFWADNVWALDTMMRFLASFFGGILVPLALFPDAARAVVQWLPFAYLYDLPVRAVTGQLGWSEWALGMLAGSGWCVALALIGSWVWHRGDRIYTGVGI
ncbi:MAG: ABC-2 family transporter protein [Acidobacteriota bacterium]